MLPISCCRARGKQAILAKRCCLFRAWPCWERHSAIPTCFMLHTCVQQSTASLLLPQHVRRSSRRVSFPPPPFMPPHLNTSSYVQDIANVSTSCLNTHTLLIYEQVIANVSAAHQSTRAAVRESRRELDAGPHAARISEADGALPASARELPAGVSRRVVSVWLCASCQHCVSGHVECIWLCAN